MPEVVPSSFRRGFTLLELLIVILLLSLFAFLVFSSVKQGVRRTASPSLLQLKETLSAQKGERELVCIEGCRRCFWLLPGGREEETSLHYGPLEAYRIDSFGQATAVEFGRWHDRKVCLRLRRYANGSTDRMILKDDEGAYYLPGFFGKVRRFESVEEAVEFAQKGQNLLRDRGDYY